MVPIRRVTVRVLKRVAIIITTIVITNIISRILRTTLILLYNISQLKAVLDKNEGSAKTLFQE